MLTQDANLAPQRHATGVSRIVHFLIRAFSAATVRGSRRRLRLCETLSFGEKRFVAIVECDRRTYLLAGAPQSISLLARLDGAPGAADSRSPQGVAEEITRNSR